MQNISIAIVGISTLFSDIHNPICFWNDICRGRDFIQDVPPSHWSISDYYDPQPGTRDRVYSHRGSFITDIQFDPIEFGMWLQAFQILHQNILQNQQMLHNALLNSHIQFIKIHELALSQLGNTKTSNTMESKSLLDIQSELSLPNVQPNLLFSENMSSPQIFEQEHLSPVIAKRQDSFKEVENPQNTQKEWNSERNNVDDSNSTNDIDIAYFENTLLQIVSEKTGYPEEMLDINVNLEVQIINCTEQTEHKRDPIKKICQKNK